MVPGVVGGDVPEEVAQCPLRDVVGLHLIPHGHLPQGGDSGPVAGNEPLEHPLVGVVLTASAVPVALGAGVDVGEVPGVAGLQKTLLHRLVQGLGDAACHKAAGGNGIPILQEGGGLLGGDELDLAHGHRVSARL